MDRCCSDHFSTGNIHESEIKLVWSYFGMEGPTRVLTLIGHRIRNEQMSWSVQIGEQ